MAVQEDETLVLLDLLSVGHGSGCAAAWRGHRDASAAAHLIFSSGRSQCGPDRVGEGCGIGTWAP